MASVKIQPKKLPIVVTEGDTPQPFSITMKDADGNDLTTCTLVMEIAGEDKRVVATPTITKNGAVHTIQPYTARQGSYRHHITATETGSGIVKTIYADSYWVNSKYTNGSDTPVFDYTYNMPVRYVQSEGGYVLVDSDGNSIVDSNSSTIEVTQ